MKRSESVGRDIRSGELQITWELLGWPGQAPPCRRTPRGFIYVRIIVLVSAVIVVILAFAGLQMIQARRDL